MAAHNMVHTADTSSIQDARLTLLELLYQILYTAHPQLSRLDCLISARTSWRLLVQSRRISFIASLCNTVCPVSSLYDLLTMGRAVVLQIQIQITLLSQF